mgnify:CR=1 FL=1
MENLSEREKIGQLIKLQRKNKKLTQAQVGKFLAIGKDVISDYENGKVKVIPFEKRVQLSILLDIDAKDLLYEQEKGNVTLGRDVYNRAIFDACYEAKIQRITDFINSKGFGSLTDAVYKIGYLSQDDEKDGDIQLDLESTRVLYHKEFLKRGLSENDALELSKFFAWLSLKNPKVLSDWYDITLREKIAAGQKENK